MRYPQSFIDNIGNSRTIGRVHFLRFMFHSGLHRLRNSIRYAFISVCTKFFQNSRFIFFVILPLKILCLLFR